MSAPRVLRGGWGLLLLLIPKQLLALGGGDRSRPVVAAARVLGARHVAESMIMAAEHDARPPRWMVGVDLVHAASMLALAGLSPRLRRDALASAGAAGVLVGLSMLEG